MILSSFIWVQYQRVTDYVHVFLFELSKAFDMVRQETLMNKTATLGIPDNTTASRISSVIAIFWSVLYSRTLV